MEQLWAPWRADYIKQPKQPHCILCEKHRACEDSKNFILKRNPNSVIMLNLYPYSNAHLMVAPYAHIGALETLSDEVLYEMIIAVRTSIMVLKQVYRPEGINVGLNIGKAAGAGIDEHLHFHIVPRWVGDTNFMSVTAGVRVIPEGLQTTFDLLWPHFNPTE